MLWTPSTCKGWAFLVLGVAAGLTIITLSIMWATRRQGVVISEPDPAGSIGNFKVIDQSISMLHGTISGQMTMVMSTAAVIGAVILLALFWMHRKNNRRTQRMGRALASLNGGQGGQGGGAQAPGQVGSMWRTQERVPAGTAGGFTLPLPDLSPSQQLATTVAQGPRTAKPMTIEEGLRTMKHAVWTVYPDGAEVAPPRRVVCERGIHQLTAEELRVFPSASPSMQPSSSWIFYQSSSHFVITCTHRRPPPRGLHH